VTTMLRLCFSAPAACAFAALSMPAYAAAAQYYGRVTFSGAPVPGVSVTLTQGAKQLSTVTDAGGLFHFDGLADGPAQLKIQMPCFTTVKAEVAIGDHLGDHAPAATWKLTLLPLDKIIALSKLGPSAPSLPPSSVTATGAHAETPDMLRPHTPENEQAANGLLVNGSSNNAATSRFSLDEAFGNRRPNGKSQYTGGLSFVFDNSALDARPYSLSGLETPKSAYNRITGVLTFGGPINIPHLMPHGPNLFVAYAWTRDRTAEAESGLVPTAAERAGDLSGLVNALGQPVPIVNPATGLPFAGNMVPVSPQAQALLALYPLPNIAGTTLYNYQAPVLDSSHQDAVFSRLDKNIGRKDEVYGGLNLQSTREGNADLFGFTDTTDTLGLNTNVHWSHRFGPRFFIYSSYKFSRLRTEVKPYFADRENVSGRAGIGGNNQQPAYWGPPSLSFASGIAGLSDGESSFNRNRTDAFSESAGLYRGRHNITVGGDVRKQEFNDNFQQNPRGSFGFTGAATAGTGTTGSDLADFLIGIPDTSALAYGNADKYLRQAVMDAYATDDWRILSSLTINAGARWEYGEPIDELKNRLVNLDIAPGFSAAAPVVATDPVGALTGARYPRSLVRPDKLGFEPRIGIAWRPLPASTVVVRAGYGIYHDTSVYEALTLQLAQQAPLSTSLSVQNSSACPLTLADGFVPCSATTADTFALDPNFRVGYAQTWQLAVQRDLPGSLQITATYLGVKGTRGVQQYLPNTYPIGAPSPCPGCPQGFVYQTSGGDSTRESGQVQLRRRLRSGFAATLLYTYSKSIDDDAALGGQGQAAASSDDEQTTASAPAASATIAQNWLNLHAERSLSSFDQRHLLSLQAQYTSGEGLGGGTLMTGRRGRLLKEWTLLTDITAGTGLPETPVYFEAVPGTGFTGTIRPDRTGAPIYSDIAPHANLHLNAAAYSAPAAGQWGSAGRYSITGPGQFSLNASLARTFRPSSHFYLDATIDATNLLNHGVFTGWDTTVNSTQFGLPAAVSPMRSIETTLRVRF
jgi:hypothetical protein